MLPLASPQGIRLLKVVDVQKPREIALEVLQGRQGGKFVEDVLEAALSRARLENADSRLCHELVFGIVRHQLTLDWLIARKTKGRVQSARLQDVLRLGLYQIFWLDRIPNHAAVNETVELAKRNRLSAQAGLINAVLQGYFREVDPNKELLPGLKVNQTHIGCFHTDWLGEHC